ncbi:MAG: B12-binding domain-containing protein [Vulcanibacillus sp.]
MSLFRYESLENNYKLASKIYDRYLTRLPSLQNEYSDAQKRSMYNDIIYNLEHLQAAIKLQDGKIFEDYALWLFQLLCHFIKNIDENILKEQMIVHYEIIEEVLKEDLSDESYQLAKKYLERAVEFTKSSIKEQESISTLTIDEYIDIKRKYLFALLDNKRNEAYEIIHKAIEAGISIEDIYQKILREVMVEVGYLWQKNIISVDKEHYCTAVTQTVLVNFYSQIFDKPKKAYKVLTTAVGSELHEMGIRMISDIFENHGWESIYLGAAVPIESILHAIKEHQPDIVALSVTLPTHLPLCKEIVEEVRGKFQDIQIIVGGRAFKTTERIWEKWEIDFYTEDLYQLIEWAQVNVEKRDVGL